MFILKIHADRWTKNMHLRYMSIVEKMFVFTQGRNLRKGIRNFKDALYVMCAFANCTFYTI